MLICFLLSGFGSGVGVTGGVNNTDDIVVVLGLTTVVVMHSAL